jgi:hypothetical protein
VTVTATQSHAQRIRAGLKHPVVDEDGHLLESLSLLMPYLDKLYTDPAAPIFEYADAGIVGDWRAAADLLFPAIEERMVSVVDRAAG